MNPLQKRASIMEETGPGRLPRLVISFATVADMQAASDFIRSMPSSQERGFDSLVAEALTGSPNPTRDQP